MTRRRVLLDGNGSTKINVEGLVVYVPAIEHDHLKQKLSAEIQQLKDQCNAMQVDLEIAVKTAETLKTVTAERDQLAAQVEALKHGVYHFNRSHGDLNPLLKAVAESPKQCLSDIRAKAIRDFAKESAEGFEMPFIEDLAEEWITRQVAKDGSA
ncbi:hypothetical protein [Shewanella xiamenensis]|uniref:hypothetical protein n=1 Tax=Shewanella xiamenensis TaxID=332186 RepID=UPI00217DCD16|nr:hypothetical protein [Shewanella xiamenensis]MCT8874158.1 hypothetical protein [Shewanella xiamenensis]UWH42829.1 hypothetical protein KXJ80_06100 [Shewanella xiamenensis]